MIILSKINNEKRAIVAGYNVFATLKNTVPNGYTLQKSINSEPFFKMILNKQHVPVKLYISDQAIINKGKYAFLIESYIKWGLKRKENLILFGGIETENETIVHILIFKNQQLISLEERTLPLKNVTYYKDAMSSLISEYNQEYPIFEHKCIYPLNIEYENIQYVDENDLKPFIKYRSFKKAHKERFSEKHLYISMGILASVLYTGNLIYWNNAFNKEKNKYILDIKQDKDIIKVGGIDNMAISILNARKEMFTQQRITPITDTAIGIAQSIKELSDINPIVEQVTFFKEQATNSALSVVVNIDKTNEKTSLESADSISKKLSQYTGLKVILTNTISLDKDKYKLFFEGYKQ